MIPKKSGRAFNNAKLSVEQGARTTALNCNRGASLPFLIIMLHISVCSTHMHLTTKYCVVLWDIGKLYIVVFHSFATLLLMQISASFDFCIGHIMYCNAVFNAFYQLPWHTGRIFSDAHKCDKSLYFLRIVIVFLTSEFCICKVWVRYFVDVC